MSTHNQCCSEQKQELVQCWWIFKWACVPFRPRTLFLLFTAELIGKLGLFSPLIWAMLDEGTGDWEYLMSLLLNSHSWTGRSCAVNSREYLPINFTVTAACVSLPAALVSQAPSHWVWWSKAAINKSLPCSLDSVLPITQAEFTAWRSTCTPPALVWGEGPSGLSYWKGKSIISQMPRII